MQHAPNRDRIRQQPSHLTHTPLFVHRIELARIEHSIPVRQVDLGLVELWTGVLEFREEPPTEEIVVILVDLAEYVADFQMTGIVVGEMLGAAGDGDAAVGTLVADMGWGHATLGGLVLFGIDGGGGGPGRLVRRVRTVGVLSHEGGAAANLRGRRVGEGVEEVVRLEEDSFFLPDILGFFVGGAAAHIMVRGCTGGLGFLLEGRGGLAGCVVDAPAGGLFQGGRGSEGAAGGDRQRAGGGGAQGAPKTAGTDGVDRHGGRSLLSRLYTYFVSGNHVYACTYKTSAHLAAFTQWGSRVRSTLVGRTGPPPPTVVVLDSRNLPVSVAKVNAIYSTAQCESVPIP